MTDPLADLSAKLRKPLEYIEGETRTAWAVREIKRAALSAADDDLDALRADHTLVRTAELEALVKAATDCVEVGHRKHPSIIETLTAIDLLKFALAPFERKEGE